VDPGPTTTSGVGAFGGGDGGTGGIGAMGGMGGMGGTGGSTTECRVTGDCGTSDECRTYACEAGVCSTTDAPLGTSCGAAGEVCNGRGQCVAASCADTVQNGDETDVDCGGSCPPCANDDGCLVGDDCSSGFCDDTGAAGGGGAGGAGATCQPCTVDGECNASGDLWCDEGVCATTLVDGDPCGGDNECASDHCVDGVCCDTACEGACDACSVAAGSSVDGVCEVVAQGAIGMPACAPYVCDGLSAACPASCSGNGDCTAGVSCSSGFCCDAPCSGTCQSCAGAHTGGIDGICADVIAGTDPLSACPSGQACDGNGSCLGALGNACGSAGDCLSGNCVDGVCCDGACGGGVAGDCQACNVAGLEGTCAPEPAATSCGDPTSNACTAPDTCDGNGTCLPNHQSAGSACGDPSSSECTSPDTCDGSGSCLANDATTGTACGDPSSTDCTSPDSCDGSGSCLANDATAGTACGDSSATACTSPDSCDGSGTCLPNHATAGTACGDPSNTACTDPDACDGNGSCLDNHATAGTACGDPSDTACTDPDACDGSGSCLENHAIAGAPCGDQGVECHFDDACDGAGFCGDGGLFAAGDPCAGGALLCTAAGDCVDCLSSSDCPGGGLCANNQCQPPSCGDGLQNQGETDIDCGGLNCGPCGITQGCSSASDCLTGNCDGGACAPVEVEATSPADEAATATPYDLVSVIFSGPVDSTSLTLKDSFADASCSGTIQVSTDDFATCIPFTSAAPMLSGGDMIATARPLLTLAHGATFKVRVTSFLDAQADVGAPYESPTGFTTVTDPFGVVISQVYGAGGNVGAVYTHDFVELHNGGSAPVDLTGWVLRYGASGGNTWNSAASLTGSIAPGGYYLVQLDGGTNGVALPPPDATGTIAMAAANGKIALLRSNTALPTGICPNHPDVVDFVGYGSANCRETTNAGALSTILAAHRADGGCRDTDINGDDFTVAAPSPRNSASTPQACSALLQNETNAAAEADFCSVQFPPAISDAAGAPVTVYGRIFEAGVTDTIAAPVATIEAQFGYGPRYANPQTQSGWTWLDAVFNVEAGNDDEYQTNGFVLPGAGTYSYAYRFSIDGGLTWTYCDVGGAGSNPNLSFEVTKLPVMSVTP
jgi:hypothetical protein